MAKIKSNIPLVYDSRDGAMGIIVIEISEWKFELKNNRFIAKVDDYISTMIDVDGEMIEQLKHIHSKDVFYPKVEVSTLFYYLNNSIELTEDYADETENLVGEALLFETQARPVYQSIDANWVRC